MKPLVLSAYLFAVATAHAPDIPATGLILDGTIGTKTLATPQIQDFINWSASRVNIVSPTVLPKP